MNLRTLLTRRATKLAATRAASEAQAAEAARTAGRLANATTVRWKD